MKNYDSENLIILDHLNFDYLSTLKSEDDFVYLVKKKEQLEDKFIVKMAINDGSEISTLSIKDIYNENEMLPEISLVPGVVKLDDFFGDYHLPTSNLHRSILVKSFGEGVVYQDDDIELKSSQMENLFDTIEKIHLNGIADLDIKPRNVALPKTGRPILFDFGTAQKLNSKNRTFFDYLMWKDILDLRSYFGELPFSISRDILDFKSSYFRNYAERIIGKL